MDLFSRKIFVAAASVSVAAALAQGAGEAAFDMNDQLMTCGAAHLAAAGRFRDEAMKNSYLFAGNADLAISRMDAARKEVAARMGPDMAKTAEAPAKYAPEQISGFFEKILPASFFEESAANRWRDEVVSAYSDDVGGGFSAEQISDFFVASEVFLGPYNENGAVVAYYNPWWDAILLTHTTVRGGIPRSEDAGSANAPKITEFEWLSGETFRGETPPQDLAKTRVRTVVPEEDPISVEIWRRQKATLACFNKIYGDDPGADQDLRLISLGLDSFDARARKTELDRIQVRAGLRLKLLSLQMKNEEAVGVAKRVTDLLRSSSVVMLKRHFTSPIHEFFCETFARLNRRAFRQGFVPYGYVPTSEGALYIFVNAQLPRLYATVSMPKGLVDGETDKPAIFEWYDLEQATEHLDAWEEDKAAKAGNGNTDKQ